MRDFEVGEIIEVPWCKYHESPLINLEDVCYTCVHCSKLDTENFVVTSSSKLDYRARKLNDESFSWRFLQPSNISYNFSLNSLYPTRKSEPTSEKHYIKGAFVNLKVGKFDQLPSDISEKQKEIAVSWIKRNCRAWPYQHELRVEICREDYTTILKWYFQKIQE